MERERENLPTLPTKIQMSHKKAYSGCGNKRPVIIVMFNMG